MDMSFLAQLLMDQAPTVVQPPQVQQPQPMQGLEGLSPQLMRLMQNQQAPLIEGAPLAQAPQQQFPPALMALLQGGGFNG